MCRSGEDKNRKYFCSQLALLYMEVALNRINPKYVRPYKFIQDGKTLKYEAPERYFASELYYQLKNLVVNSDIFDAKISVDAEVPKRGYPVENRDGTCESDKTSYVLPDIVIHGGLTDYDTNNQLLVCEIKRRSRITEDSIKRDLQKLGWYIKSLWYDNMQVGFGAGCFIVMNYSKEELYSYMLNFFRNNGNRSLTFTGVDGREERLSDIAKKITIFSYKEGADNKAEVGKFLLADVF